MLLDMNTLFSDDQAITADAASTNYMDLKAAATPPGAPASLGRKIGGGNDIPILIQVTADFASCDSLTVSIEVDDNTSFSSARKVAATPAVPVASLVAGYQFPIVTIPNTVDERYVRLHYDVGGSNATAGTVTASITTAIQTNG